MIRIRLLVAVVTVLAVAVGFSDRAHADAITKVQGVIVDDKGKPLAKVPVYFEAVDIKKVVGPVKTNKKGNYFIATLDTSVAKKWRVVPKLTGYKTVKVSFEIVDSTGATLGSDENLVGSKQDHPDFRLVLVGNVGRNKFDFVLAREKNYLAAYRAEKRKKDGGGTAEVAENQQDEPRPEARELAKSLEKAKQFTSAGRHAEAIEIYSAFLAQDPKGNPPVYYYLGKSLFNTGDAARAEQAFRRALELQPAMKGCHFFLGNIAVNQGEFPAAVSEFEAELALSPDSDSVLFNLGQAHVQAGQLDQGLAAFERAAELNPDKSEIFMQMASVHEQRREKGKAEEMYQRVIAMDPKNAALSFYNIGVHAWNENRGSEAATAFRKALELDPAYAVTHRELARALMGMQDFPGALQHFEEYLKLNPAAPDASEIRDSIALLRQ